MQYFKNMSTRTLSPTSSPSNLEITGWSPQAIYGVVFGILTIILAIVGVLLAWNAHRTIKPHFVNLGKLEHSGSKKQTY